MKPLFLPLRTRWFREFQAGIKTIEYRVYGPRWHEQTCTVGRPVVVSHGYSGDRLTATIKRFRRIPLSRAPKAARELFPDATHLAAITLDLTG